MLDSIRLILPLDDTLLCNVAPEIILKAVKKLETKGLLPFVYQVDLYTYCFEELKRCKSKKELINELKRIIQKRKLIDKDKVEQIIAQSLDFGLRDLSKLLKTLFKSL